MGLRRNSRVLPGGAMLTSSTMLTSLIVIVAAGCSSDDAAKAATDPTIYVPNVAGDSGKARDGKDGASETSVDAGSDAPVIIPSELTIHFVPESGVTGSRRINFAVPFPRGAVSNETNMRLRKEATELDAGRRVLARYADGSIRSLQWQFDDDVQAEFDVTLVIGEPASHAGVALVPVEQTLSEHVGTRLPDVWSSLPASWLSASGALGPLSPEADATGPLAKWGSLCDYSRFGADALFAVKTDSGSWQFDRTTALYRGFARRGDLSIWRSAYREIDLYRSGVHGSASATTIGLTGKENDISYYFVQGAAIHYLLTGDDRYRDLAEDLADRIAWLWPTPLYTEATPMWTERHAAFALLGYVWAGIVSDNRAADFATLADQTGQAYLTTQSQILGGYTDPDARCFAHLGTAAQEAAFLGCSPWQSAVLADAIDQLARERDGEFAANLRTSVIKLGRLLARRRDPNGKPYFWLQIGGTNATTDPNNEHWGESAYVVAMARHHAGGSDAELQQAAEALITGFDTHAVAPHLRSFNWQCRSAVATPYFMTH